MIKKAIFFLCCLTFFSQYIGIAQADGTLETLMGEYKIDDGHISGDLIINNNRDDSFTVVINTTNEYMHMCNIQFNNIKLTKNGNLYIGNTNFKDAVSDNDFYKENGVISISIAHGGLVINGPSNELCGIGTYYNGAYSYNGYIDPAYKELRNNIYEMSPFWAYLIARQNQVEQKVENFGSEYLYVVTGNVVDLFMASDYPDNTEYPSIIMKGGFIAKLKQDAKFPTKKYINKNDKVTLLCGTLSIEFAQSNAFGICTPIKIESENQNTNTKTKYINKKLYNKFY